jgi:hypothetical protein
MGPRKTNESNRFIQPHGHALFATVETNDGTQTLTFRVGQPVKSFSHALDRFGRLWAAGAIDRGQSKPLAQARVRYGRRWYRVRFMEVRATDRHGRGLGAERHAAAIPVPYRSAQRTR